MTEQLKIGTEVRWAWGQHTAEGRVTEVFIRRVQRTIAGTRIVRRATQDNPAYLIEQQDGGRALRSGSELRTGS